MKYYAVDTRDRIAQAVSSDYSSDDPRFIKVMADTARGAIDAAINGLSSAGEFKRAVRLTEANE